MGGVSDLDWQIDQLKTRGVKTDAGNPYNPSHYKRGLSTASEKGGPEVVETSAALPVQAPERRLPEARTGDSLDLTCEHPVSDDTKPYASLFTDEDRAVARKRLGAHARAIEARRPSTAPA